MKRQSIASDGSTIVSNSCVDTGVQIRNEFGGLCTRSVCDRGSLQRRQSSKTRRRRPTLRLDRLLYFCALSVVTWAGGRLLQFILDLSTPDLGSGGVPIRTCATQSILSSRCNQLVRQTAPDPQSSMRAYCHRTAFLRLERGDDFATIPTLVARAARSRQM